MTETPYHMANMRALIIHNFIFILHCFLPQDTTQNSQILSFGHLEQFNFFFLLLFICNDLIISIIRQIKIYSIQFNCCYAIGIYYPLQFVSIRCLTSRMLMTILIPFCSVHSMGVLQDILGNAIISISAVIRHSTAFKVQIYKSNGLQNVNI